MNWLEEIIQVYKNNPRPMKLKEIYDYVLEHSTRDLPENYDAIIRRTIEYYSSDSRAYLNHADIFHSTYGIGKGVWELRNSIQVPKAPDISEPDIPNRITVVTNRIIRDTLLSRQLKNLYQDKCQICEKTLVLINQNYSEAHHIKPLGDPHRGTDEWSNILILCPNHHVEFDYGAIAIDPMTLQVISAGTNEFSGTELIIESEHTLNSEFLLYHLENIFNR